jgi:hypothetical protein
MGQFFKRHFELPFMSLNFLRLGDHVPVQVGEVLAPDVVGLLLGQPQHTLHLSHSEIYRDSLMRRKENIQLKFNLNS